jgi:hypothetical protein
MSSIFAQQLSTTSHPAAMARSARLGDGAVERFHVDVVGQQQA